MANNNLPSMQIVQTQRFRNEDIIGFVAAAFLHLGLLGVLLLVKPDPPMIVPVEQTVTVSLAEDIGLEATAPELVTESAAPAFGDSTPQPPAPDPEVFDVPEPATPPIVESQPAPEPVRTSAPKPVTKPKPRVQPQPKQQPKPQATKKPTPKQTTAAQRKPTPKSNNKPVTPPRSNNPAKPTKPAGSSRDFAKSFGGLGSSTSSKDPRAPANKIGPTEMAALDSAIGRQVKVKWQGRVPQGPDSEKLVTRVRFRLNPDGSLAGEPTVAGNTTGVTDLNKNQVGRHQEEAIRAIKLAAPFKVPFPVPASSNSFTLKFDRNY